MHTNTFTTFYQDHGTNPTNGSYQYVVLPNTDPDATAQYDTNPDVRLLTNSASVQAVQETHLGLVGANIFDPAGGTVDLPDQPGFLHTKTSASVITRHDGDDRELSVSDPTMTQDSVTVDLGVATTHVVTSDLRLHVLQYTPTTKLKVDVAGTVGGASEIRLATTGRQDQPPPQPVEFGDPLDDWSLAYAHSDGWKLDTSSAQLVAGDTSRAARVADTVETIDYSVADAQSVSATVFSYASAQGLELFVSPDGQTWSPVDGSFSAPIPGTQGGWLKNTFASTRIPVRHELCPSPSQLRNAGVLTPDRRGPRLLQAPGATVGSAGDNRADGARVDRCLRSEQQRGVLEIL